MVLCRERNWQFGRSMLEILGVLVIIGLISSGGLYGYRRSINKHKANEVISAANKRAVMVAAQIAALGEDASEEDLNNAYWDADYDPEQDEWDISAGRSPRRDGSNLRVKKYDPKFKEFAVVIPEMEKEVCQEILNSLGSGSQIQALVASNGYGITDCDEADLQDVEIVYKDDLSPLNANQTNYSDSDIGNGSIGGDEGAGNSSNSDDNNESDSTKFCPRGTKEMPPHEGCFKCDKYDNCGCREIGMVANGDGFCMCLNEGATECDGNKALSCSSGYFLNGESCSPCPENATCAGGTGAFDCKEGYTAQEGGCCPTGLTCTRGQDGEYVISCPPGKQLASDGKSCVACSKKPLAKDSCGCSDPTPYPDGKGGCAECRSNTHCDEKMGQDVLQCVNYKCVPTNGCPMETPILSRGHCCPTATPKWDEKTGSCIENPNQFEGQDGHDYSCDTDYAIRVTGVRENCSVCPNREVLYMGSSEWGYFCVPKCKNGEFLMRTSTDTIKPKVYCESCNTSTIAYANTFSCSDCESSCPNRECHQSGYSTAFMCLVKECPNGTYPCSSGCCSCQNLRAGGVGRWFHTALRYNAREACAKCGDREVITSSTPGQTDAICAWKNCPTNSFRGRATYDEDCISCTDGGQYISTKEECDKCVGSRYYEKGYCIKGTTCANGSTYNPESGCGDCAPGYFYVAGKCIDCNDSGIYLAAKDATECAKCNGLREMHVIQWGGGNNGPTCMRKKKDGEFYSGDGTLSCDSPTAGYTMTHIDDCLVACPNRIATEYAQFCMLPKQCGDNAFWSKSGCVSCDAEADYKIQPFYKRENNQNVWVVPSCSELCPGKRFARGEFCQKCLTDPSRYKTQEECESCQGSWNEENNPRCTLPGGTGSESESESEEEIT